MACMSDTPSGGTAPKGMRLVPVALAVAFSFVVGLAIGSADFLSFNLSPRVSQEQPEDIDFGPLYASWRILEEQFVPATTTEPITDQELVWGAIQGLASSYGDPYTVFFPPVEKELFESEVRGDFEGVGMEIGIRDELLTVIAPLKDTPAYRAGIQSGDIILEIDGESTAGITVENAVRVIRGEKGTPVEFVIAREGERVDVTVVRDTILLPTLDTTLRDDGIFVIELYGFNATAPQLFRNAIREFGNTTADKMIIDLRGNPGGFLEVSVDLASWFLPLGKPVVFEDYGDESQDRAHRSRGYDVFNDNLKLVILIDQGSASASEIFAGALREHGKATLIGNTSFGKGSVQQVFPVTDDTSLKITIARWLTPDGISISDGGITPDIEVEFTAEDREAGEDPQLDRAIEFLLTGE